MKSIKKKNLSTLMLSFSHNKKKNLKQLSTGNNNCEYLFHLNTIKLTY